MLSHNLPDQRPSDRGTFLIQPSTLACRLARCKRAPTCLRDPRGPRKETTSLFTSANRSIKTRWPAWSRTRSVAPGMDPARAAALATGT